MKTATCSKLIYLVVILSLGWGLITCSKGGSNPKGPTSVAPVADVDCSVPILADPGGDYDLFCGDEVTLRGQNSCAKSGILEIQWNFEGNYQILSGGKTLNPTISYSCGSGSGAERYTARLIIKDILSRQATGEALIILRKTGCLNFATNRIQAQENDNSITIEVQLSKPNQDSSKETQLPNYYNDPITIDYFTVDGTATSPEDYHAVTGTLSFSYVGETQTISIPLVNDNNDEGAEFFMVKLQNPTHATLGDDLIMCEIFDPEPTPTPTPTSIPTTPTPTPTPRQRDTAPTPMVYTITASNNKHG